MNDPFACPAPGCDVFPYETAQDLAAHLLSDHAGAPPATPTRLSAPKGSTPGRTAPVKVPVGVSTAAEPIEGRRDHVRVGGWSGTFAPAPAPRRTAKDVRMATDPMKGFIRNLVADVPGAVLPDLDALTFSAASTLIDDLKARKAATPTANRTPKIVPEGFHLHDGTVYKVQTSKTGNTYAKVLVLPDDPEEDGDWEYVGKRPFRFLSEATVATLETAQAFGLRTTHCMCCGRHLEVKESVERGIGPVCFAKYF